MTRQPAAPDSTSEIQPAAMMLATWRASRGERRLASAVILLSLIAFALVAPWAKLPLPRVDAFMPMYEAGLVLGDIITAVLFFGQFRIARSKALLVLASGYLFTAFATIAHALSFPGLFAPAGLLGGGAQTTAWIYMFWHGGFPLFVIAYALSSNRVSIRGAEESRLRLAMAYAIAIPLSIVAALTWFATIGHANLPAIMNGSRYTTTMLGTVFSVWLAGCAALAMLVWRTRPRSVLDLWLIVVLCAWLIDIALAALLNAGRFDLGFYAGRAFGLIAAGFVLMRLLLENAALYDRLFLKHVEEQRRGAELQRLALQLESSNARSEEQSRFKSEFLANMSHELRTPLNAILGFSELLKEGLAGPLTDQQQSFAAHIFKSGRHLLALINDILDLSKIEAGKVDIELQQVDFDRSLAETLAMMALRAKERGIRVEAKYHDDDVSSFLADPRRFKQILLNLLSNAVKFSPDEGLVTVHVSLVDRARAEVALPGNGQGMRLQLPPGPAERFVEISVFDAGIGIAHEDMRRLYTPFTQVSNSVTRSAEGTGLGLAMVRLLAELHGGTVGVTSQPGHGSCFTVWLPWRASPAPVQTRARPATTVVVQTGRQLALVVEDNDAAARLMRAQLETEGFEVRRVETAEAALELVSELTPAVITLDIQLPGMDGWQFLARMKDTPGWENVPVVVVSVLADQGKGFSLGASLVLQKPVGRETLVEGLQHLRLAPSAGRDVTVLVIDDDPGAVELLATHLRQSNYLVVRASGGREGIDLARQSPPDLIALDLEMPEVNGFDVVAALKSNPSTDHIPIMIVTAKDLTPTDRRRLSGHVLDIVGKADFNHGNFVGEVQRALSMRGSPRGMTAS